MKLTLVAITGLPLSGKSTLGRNLAPILGIHYCDSDELRATAFGVPTHNEYMERWKDPERAAQLIHEDMILTYRLLHETVDLSFATGRSLIISATYASKSSQEFLKKIVEKHGAQLKLIVCRIEQETREELERRMHRDDNSKFVYGSRTWEDYQRVEKRYASPDKTGIFSPHNLLIVDAGQPVEYCVNISINFILS